MYLLPTPKKLELSGGMLTFSRETNMPKVTKRISKELFIKESYRLTVDGSGVLIEASDDAGLYYGECTLKQLLMNYRGCLPHMYISDEPEYAYRGFMIDSCRHFFTVDEIKKMIDAAALLKFNKFHFHLSDDQGFRIESERFPLLTEKGSVRKGSHFDIEGFSDDEYKGYYTKKELKDIVEYCRVRHIEVIPEIDFPGHTTAILSVFPELSCTGKDIEPKIHGGIFDDILCGGNPETLKFYYALIDELLEIFPGEYFHIGGDEVPKIRWENCEKCRAKIKELGLSNADELQGCLANEIALYLKSKGKKAICWNEELNGGNIEHDNMTVSLWLDRKNVAVKWANAGGPLIVESYNPYYVDYPYGMHTLKNAYFFDPKKIKGLDFVGRGSIVGVESPIWTEHIDTFKQMSFMCFPRWFAVAETAWHGSEGRNFSKFLDTTKFFCDIIKEMGHFPAPEEYWNILPHERVSQIVKFFKNSATKENVDGVISGIFKKKNKNGDNEND